MSFRVVSPGLSLGFLPSKVLSLRSALRKTAHGGVGATPAVGCPHHARVGIGDDRKTETSAASHHGLTVDANGDVTITSHTLAKQFLKSRSTEQAGFNADLVKLFPQKNTSVLFLEGEAHRQRRSVVARFFAPLAVRERYRPVMETVSADLVDALTRKGSASLDDMSLELAVGVTAEIVGMTESPRLDIAKRLVRFFEGDACVTGSGWLPIARYILAMQVNLFRVYLRDVRPAIKARRRAPREDLISHLIEMKWSHLDILKECVTYATAGMSTTREFIVVAAWHMLENADLRQRFLDGDIEARTAILGEILRLEPPVSMLYRKTVEPIVLDDQRGSSVIPAGSRVSVDLNAVNTDGAAAGQCPFRLDVDREVPGPAGLMSFGDGHHRCPGASIAMEEAMVFLDRLIRVPNIRFASTPVVSRNKMSTGYVLRNAVLITN